MVVTQGQSLSALAGRYDTDNLSLYVLVVVLVPALIANHHSLLVSVIVRTIWRVSLREHQFLNALVVPHVPVLTLRMLDRWPSYTSARSGALAHV